MYSRSTADILGCLAGVSYTKKIQNANHAVEPAPVVMQRKNKNTLFKFVLEAIVKELRNRGSVPFARAAGRRR